MNKKGLFLAVGLLTLSSCGESPIKVVDLNSAIQRLQQVDNYEVIRKSENGTILFDGLYHPNYFYEEKANLGFLKKDGNVYPFSIKDNLIVNKEVRSYHEIYGKENAWENFDCLDASKIEAGKNQIKTKLKSIAVPLLAVSGYSASKYMETVELKMDLKNNNDSFLDIEFTFEKYQAGQAMTTCKEYVTVTKINQVSDAKIEEFIEKGNIIPIHENLKKLRTYFQNDNFTEYRKDEDGDVFNATYYHPKYYVNLFSKKAISKEPLLAAQQILNLEILEPNKKLDFFKANDESTYSPMIYDDVYLFNYSGNYDEAGEITLFTQSDPTRPGYARGCFERVIKDIRGAWHNPKYLNLFDDLGMFSSLSDEVFETEDAYAMQEYVNDLGYKEFVEQYGGPLKLRVQFNDNADASKATAVFQIFLKNAPQAYVEVSYGNFGSTKFEPFEDVLKRIAETPNFK